MLKATEVAIVEHNGEIGIDFYDAKGNVLNTLIFKTKAEAQEFLDNLKENLENIVN